MPPPLPATGPPNLGMTGGGVGPLAVVRPSAAGAAATGEALAEGNVGGAGDEDCGEGEEEADAEGGVPLLEVDVIAAIFAAKLGGNLMPPAPKGAPRTPARKPPEAVEPGAR